MIELVTRARGLAGRRLDDRLAAEGPEAVERAVRKQLADDLAILGRWSGHHRAALAAVELDEDRRSVRAILRGLVGGIATDRRLLACVPTAGLPLRGLARLAEATHTGQLAAVLRDYRHPFSDAFATRQQPTVDLLAIEIALTRLFVAHALVGARDRALRGYITNIIDVENAIAALELASRGTGLTADAAFVSGGDRLHRDAFARAAASPQDARDQLAEVFARTPLAGAWTAAPPSAIDDALLAWQLTTARRLRRVEPHGFAGVLVLVLERRDQARRLRRSAWQRAMGGTW